jgi:hypothetical protein
MKKRDKFVFKVVLYREAGEVWDGIENNSKGFDNLRDLLAATIEDAGFELGTTAIVRFKKIKVGMIDD